MKKIMIITICAVFLVGIIGGIWVARATNALGKNDQENHLSPSEKDNKNHQIEKVETKEEKIDEIESFDLSEPYYIDSLEHFSSDRVLGSVNSADEAKKKAEEVWLDVYGDLVLEEKPYVVRFDENNQAWLIQGSLPKPENGETIFGGVANIIIRKSDGKVLAIWHDK